MQKHIIAKINPITPIMCLRTNTRMRLLDNRIIAERSDDARRMVRVQSPKRCKIEMIVMIMRNEDDIDWRKA